MSEAIDREVARAKKFMSDEKERAEKLVNETAAASVKQVEEWEKSAGADLHRHIDQAEADMRGPGPAPDRGGFGGHGGDQFAEVPQDAKPEGAPAATPSRTSPGAVNPKPAVGVIP